MPSKGEWGLVDSDPRVPTKVKSTSGRGFLVNDEEKEKSLPREQEEIVDDMIYMDELTEASLLRNLRLRHKQGIIYTYIGSVLVAVNPYRSFPIYSDDQIRLYQYRKLGELPPHIFAIAESCYSNMTRSLKNQCCIISGESGAGKTESTKLILQYLAAVSGEHSEQHIEQQILESNPILEAFGNAKTIRNDNSSRFGKYLEIFFSEDGVIQGASVEQYLLEKSRICHQAMEERNYHIFYCMLAGVTAEEKKALRLGNAKDYTFLTRGSCIVCEGRNDAEDYKRIRSAMKILTFSESQCQEILKLLAAILHLGNMSFEANTENNLDTSDVAKSEHFSAAASLLEVHKSSLARSLTHRSILANRERVTKPLSSEQAADSRDAFVKAIYNKLYIWIVRKINRVTYKRLAKSSKSSLMSIGLLDIFGFENFETNSFEQLCINFANEKLQQFFVDQIFKQEQEEYLKDGVVWKNMKFIDNQNILDLLAVKPCNVLALIDEETQFPKGSDVTMLQKMNKQHTGNKSYVASKREYDTNFGIQHFAGVVYYNSKGFLEKNRDTISFEIIKMVDMSANKLLHEIFDAELSANEGKTNNNKRVIMTPKSSSPVQADNRKQVPTLSAQFRQSLDSLMKALSACHPFFIRCFKPNNDKQSKVFDRDLCMRQLRYSGMMDTIHIRRLGYPVRHTFVDFLKRYRVLLDTSACDPKYEKPAACCEAICKRVITGKHQWKIGRTKIFLRDVHDAFLERLRDEELDKNALVIQRFMRGCKDRMSFQKKRKAAVVLQRNWRAYKVEKERRKLRHGFERLASKIVSRRLQHQYQRQRAAALTIQRHLRGYHARRGWEQKRKAVVVLQAYTRGLKARKRAADMRKNILDLQLGLKILDDVISESDRSEVESNAPEPEVKIIPPSSRSSSISTVPTLSSEEDDGGDTFDDIHDEFSFYKFSILHFQGDATHTHIAQRLEQPLLQHEDEGDALACLSVWWIILRFMEDLPEPRSTDTMSQTSSNVTQRSNRFGRRLSSLVGLDQKILRMNKKRFGGGARKPSMIPEEPDNITEDDNILVGEGPTLDRPLSSQDKLDFIIGYALSKRNIRDEIYCQICKQLVNNMKASSRKQGWILLSICLGIFPPTDFFVKYLENFVRKGPTGYGQYCTNRLSRIKANGERMELPCRLEIQAARTMEPIDASVVLMDDTTVSLHLDSASTSAEVCQDLANEINLQDTYGFSLYISLNDKMWSLGSCGKHVLDAVSQCEEEIRRQGRAFRGVTWKLSIRKELFRPWHDCSVDPVSTDLIYRQVIKGLKSGEYTSEKEDEYVSFAAKHYYIQFGSAYDKDNVQRVVEECIATTLIESKSMTKWIQLISQAHLQGVYVKENPKKDIVKGEVVDSARQNWPVYFSRFFEVLMTSGPPLPKSRFVVAVNGQGVLFMDGKDKKLLELPYYEMKEVKMMSDIAPSVSLATVRGEFVLKSTEVADMAALIEEHLEGLRQRSEYAVVQRDVSKPDDPMFLVLKRGDMLVVEKNEEYSPENNWFRATNQRTGTCGAVYKDTVQFLPTLSKPPDETVELLTPGQRRASVTQIAKREETVIPYFLKEFALENFRPPNNVGRQGASRGISQEKLWVYSKEPLKQALLKRVVYDPELNGLACNAFTAILKYMGDYPLKHARSPVELTEQIFGPATRDEALQDEIYCQIMRQMTRNISRISMEHGWQLMWLCTGLFPPGPNLMIHTQRFLETRPRDLLAAGCMHRLQEIRSKLPRTFPPHVVEVDAIQQNSEQIFQKVHFPNETDDIFEVTSTTTIKDLCQSIASHLQLNSADGYGLYVKTPTKVTPLNEQAYFFDGLKQTTDSPKKARKGKEVRPPFLVMCKRKLWFNVSPGKDLVADLTFHFPQELAKYLHGYHNCTKEDMANLGGLLFRVIVDSDRMQFVMIPRMLKNLIPGDQIKSMTPEEWKKHIISAYNRQSGITVQEAKLAFLKAISSWPTFGCTFFEVRQFSEPDYPNTVWIAISKQSFNIIDPETKEILSTYPFSRITDYSSRGGYFQMTISALVRGVNFDCECSQADTIADVLSSYKNMYVDQTQVVRRASIFT